MPLKFPYLFSPSRVDSPAFKCTVCNKVCRSSGGLLKHTQRVHPYRPPENAAHIPAETSGPSGVLNRLFRASPPRALHVAAEAVSATLPDIEGQSHSVDQPQPVRELAGPDSSPSDNIYPTTPVAKGDAATSSRTSGIHNEHNSGPPSSPSGMALDFVDNIFHPNFYDYIDDNPFAPIEEDSDDDEAFLDDKDPLDNEECVHSHPPGLSTKLTGSTGNESGKVTVIYHPHLNGKISRIIVLLASSILTRY